MAEPKNPILTGGCQCGAIRYVLTAPPESVHLCHCRMCQKAVGGPFAAPQCDAVVSPGRAGHLPASPAPRWPTVTSAHAAERR
jgi:hypothetical protein